ncbi:MAG: hypothetical protein COT43_02800 [Candidatus Marinimicrobia bacterium CG08_land_8_20_14_0_20_45_22]|nr:MAG: hypothetical protein COT43_02800 [Candidatus Marinimicrobia bacterium CG08_land_8_20_14_0_20_45_22]
MKNEALNEQNLSQAQEDYLKIILDLIGSHRVARIKEIAQRKNVSMPTVSEAMRKLAQDGLINYSAHELIELTPQGEQTAHQITARHQFLRYFLQEILNIPTDTANAEACALEHHLSAETLERLILLYQFLTNCPRFDENLIEIFRQCLTAENQPDHAECHDCFVKIAFPHTLPDHHTIHIRLADLPEGQEGVIVILGIEAEKRRILIGQGFVPGATIKMERSAVGDQPFIVKLKGLQSKISPELARLIEVAVQSENQQTNMNTNETVVTPSNLAGVPTGQRFRIKKVCGEGEIWQRLIDLGFIKNEVGLVIREALLKDPIEVEIKGTRVSLRRSEARLIETEVLN